MTLKKTLPAMTLMLALLFTVSTAMAQPPAASDDKKQPRKMSQMSPEDYAAWTEIWKENRAKIDPLRDQMWAKRLEYDALLANPNTKPEAVKAVIDEMLRLKVQLRSEHDKVVEAAQAKGLDARGFGHGFNKGWRGHGPGCGFGDGPGMGYGNGPGRHRGGYMMMTD